MMVKKYLKHCAEADKRAILESEKSKTILQKLLAKNAEQTATTNPNCTCPDCGNPLVFMADFGRFMHKNCEELNCWYAADEQGQCVDNNKLRAERISKFCF